MATPQINGRETAPKTDPRLAKLQEAAQKILDGRSQETSGRQVLHDLEAQAVIERQQATDKRKKANDSKAGLKIAEDNAKRAHDTAIQKRSQNEADERDAIREEGEADAIEKQARELRQKLGVPARSGTAQAPVDARKPVQAPTPAKAPAPKSAPAPAKRKGFFR